MPSPPGRPLLLWNWTAIPIYSHTPGAFDHGSTVHWVPLPSEDLTGKTLTVYSPSSNLTVLAGDHNDLILYYRDANALALLFALLFFLFGIGILLMSLTARLLLKRTRPWTLRYLGVLVLFMSLWVASDTTVAQMFTGRIAVMNVLAHYTFMALPYFLVQFFRSLWSRIPNICRFCPGSIWLTCRSAAFCKPCMWPPSPRCSSWLTPLWC